MQPYANQSGTSGVLAFEIRPRAIVVQFKGGRNYLYTNASAGAAAIKTMHALARAGKGLSAFVTQHKPRYEEELELS